MLKRAKGSGGRSGAGEVVGGLRALETCVMQRWAAGMGSLSRKQNREGLGGGGGWEDVNMLPRSCLNKQAVRYRERRRKKAKKA